MTSSPRPLTHRLARWVVGLALMLGAAAQATPVRLYPLWPNHSEVWLPDSAFVASVLGVDGEVPLSGVAGHQVDQHPGAVLGPGGSFIGLFGRATDIAHLGGTALYLWETSCCQHPYNPAEPAAPGPLLQLGYFDGLSVVFHGQARAAQYRSTSTASGGAQPFDIASSAMTLADFGIEPGLGPLAVNAVRVSYNPAGHNQVTAIALGLVAEPPSASLALLALCGAGLAGRAVRRRAIAAA